MDLWDLLENSSFFGHTAHPLDPIDRFDPSELLDFVEYHSVCLERAGSSWSIWGGVIKLGGVCFGLWDPLESCPSISLPAVLGGTNYSTSSPSPSPSPKKHIEFCNNLDCVKASYSMAIHMVPVSNKQSPVRTHLRYWQWDRHQIDRKRKTTLIAIATPHCNAVVAAGQIDSDDCVIAPSASHWTDSGHWLGGILVGCLWVLLWVIGVHTIRWWV